MLAISQLDVTSSTTFSKEFVWKCMCFMCLFSSFKLSITLISPFFIIYYFILGIVSPGQCSASSIAPLFITLFISWSMASDFFSENFNMFGTANWFGADSFMRYPLMIPEISELLVMLAQFSLYNYQPILCCYILVQV